MTRALAFIDTETDGLEPGRRIWDIAIIRREIGESVDGDVVVHDKKFQAFIEVDLRKANLQGLYIGRFYDRHPVGRVLSGLDPVQQTYPRVLTEHEAAVRIAQLTHDATIVGAVPNFDTEAIAGLLRKNGITPAWHHRLRCVETLASGRLGRELGGLDQCAEALGLHPIPADDRHTAYGDALQAQAIYDAVMTAPALAG